ncbi:hypothetical protein JCM11251_007211 [Rhodosporidiobolus azoricus]
MGKSKAPKSTPRTTEINPAAVSTSLTAFSPSTSTTKNSTLYAHLHCAPDAHTLRVFDVDSGKVLSRWSSAAGEGDDDELRVKSIEWCWVPSASAGGETGITGTSQAEGKRGKKRRKSDGGGAIDSPAKGAAKPQPPQLTLALGLENGSVLLWHPNGTGSRTLSHPTSNSPVTALAAPVSSSAQEDGHLWTAHADGSVRVWETQTGSCVGKVTGLNEEPRWDDLLVRYEPAGEDGAKRSVHLVLSHLSLHVYGVQLAGASKKEGKVRELKATNLGSCTGHVEPCSLRWTGLSSSSSASSSALDMSDDSPASPADKLTFLSFAPTDRFVQVWSLPLHSSTSSPANGMLLARLATDSGVSSAIVSPLSSASAASAQTLAAVDSATGNVSVTSLPLSFAPSSASPSKKGKKHAAGVVALEVLCEITAPAAGGRSEANVAEVSFRSQEEGKALLSRGGVKPVFEVAAIKEEGEWVKKLELARSASGLLVGHGQEQNAGAPQPARYSEQASSSVAAATSAPDAAAASDDEEFVNSGELDVDSAEPTLADRLKALNVSHKKERRKAARKAKVVAAQDGGLDEDVEVVSESSGSEDEDEFADEDDEVVSAVPATTLTTTLVQALHSQDGPLLESCLAHSNPALVRSTVKRLPSGGLVLSLLEAIVDHLGKEKKGKKGMASVKRAKALIGWLKETLIVHVGFLVTIPSLVNRLSALHASLTQRLALQQPLLALNGRLDLVMSQIDLRQDRVRAAAPAAGTQKKQVKQGRRYVEGESTDEEESGTGSEGDEDEEIEEGDVSEGDVEDVVLGGGDDFDGIDSEDDEDEVDSAFEDEEDGTGSNKPRRKVNGVSNLLDLEAEEDEDFDEDEDFEQDGFLNDEGDEDEEEAGEDSEFEE